MIILTIFKMSVGSSSTDYCITTNKLPGLKKKGDNSTDNKLDKG